MLSRILRRIRPTTTVIVPAADKAPLDLRERMAIRDWLALPITQRALGILEARHPGTNLRVGTVARSEWDERAAVNYLNRIKGWESYRNALITLAEDPEQATTDVNETYPSQ